MNYLKGKSFYLCGGIHSAENDGTHWRNVVTPLLENAYEAIVYDPCKMTIDTLGEVGEDKKMFQKLIVEKRFDELKNVFNNIVKKDIETVIKSDFLLVYYDPSIPMVGTIEEAVISFQKGKNLILLIHDSFLPKANPWMFRYFDTKAILSNIDELQTYLDKINQEGI